MGFFKMTTTSTGALPLQH